VRFFLLFSFSVSGATPIAKPPRVLASNVIYHLNERKHKNNIMKNSQIAIITILFLSFFVSCSDTNDKKQQVSVCDSSNTEFQQLYNQLIVANDNSITTDAETHAYIFEVTSQKNICSIGYQSLPAMAAIPYLIEIHDNTSNTALYSGESLFSSSTTSYVSVGSIPLVVGHTYTVKRTPTNLGGNIANAIGRVVINPNNDFTFPLAMGSLKIINARFNET
jgi:hypothetical protein